MPALQRYWTAEAVFALMEEDRTGTRYELLDGELLVTNAPSIQHQRAVRELLRILHEYAERVQIGEGLLSPAAIQLAEESLMQPDVFVVSKATMDTWEMGMKWGIVKSLTLAVEVLSPSNPRTDRVVKRDFYLDHNVSEYWIVDIDSRVIERWTSDQRVARFDRNELVWQPAGAAEPLVIDLDAFFFEVTGTRFL